MPEPRKNWPLLAALFVFVALVSTTAALYWWFMRADAHREGIKGPYSEMQTGPRVVVDENATNLIQRDAQWQSRFSEVSPDWPHYRGAGGTGIVPGVRVVDDWNSNPPKPLWRRASGEGWSGVVIAGDRVINHEQREEMECVVCLDFDSGDELWVHADKARMPKSQNGFGPRATPAVSDHRVVSFGATGILNCLDLESGDLIWSLDTENVFAGSIPGEGSCSSPLIIDQTVVIFVPGCDKDPVIAIDLATGEPRWRAGRGNSSFSSPHWAQIARREQILMASDVGLESFDPKSGESLWTFESDDELATRMLQPCVLDDDSVLLFTGQGQGVDRIKIISEDDRWRTQSVWQSQEYQPYLSNPAIYQGHFFGSENAFHCCIDLLTGMEKWRERGLGGQAIVFPDSGQQLVVGLRGTLWLQALTTEGLVESAKMEDAVKGECLANPAFARNRIVLRNQSEIACYELTLDHLDHLDHQSSVSGLDNPSGDLGNKAGRLPPIDR